MKDSLIGILIRYGLGIVIVLALIYVLFACVGCASTKHAENVNIRDSVAIRWRDSIRWHVRDSVNIIEHHVTVRDSSGLFIQFAQGGGTYNSKTGEATNVAGVQQSDTHHEQRDSTNYYRALASDYKHSADSIADRYNTLQSEYRKVVEKSRTGYDRFCSWWFWITALLLLIKIAAWIMEKFPVTAPYIYTIRKFIPFL